jgi:ketosteroid isomerase-like protein
MKNAPSQAISAPNAPVRYGQPGFIAAYGAAWGDADTLVSFYAPDGQYTDKGSGVTVKGHPALHRFMRVYLGFSPKCIVTFTNTVESKNGFAAEWVWTGNNDGSLRLQDGFSPRDGSPFSVDGISICTVNDLGQILTHTDYWDAAPLLRQWKAALAKS